MTTNANYNQTLLQKLIDEGANDPEVQALEARNQKLRETLHTVATYGAAATNTATGISSEAQAKLEEYKTRYLRGELPKSRSSIYASIAAGQTYGCWTVIGQLPLKTHRKEKLWLAESTCNTQQHFTSRQLVEATLETRCSCWKKEQKNQDFEL